MRATNVMRWAAGALLAAALGFGGAAAAIGAGLLPGDTGKAPAVVTDTTLQPGPATASVERSGGVMLQDVLSPTDGRALNQPEGKQLIDPMAPLAP